MRSQGSNSNFTKNKLMGSPAARQSAWNQLHCMEHASNNGKVTQLRPRPSELPLDTELMQEARRQADGVNRLAGIALLVVTFVIAIVLLWPFLSERFA